MDMLSELLDSPDTFKGGPDGSVNQVNQNSYCITSHWGGTQITQLVSMKHRSTEFVDLSCRYTMTT